MTITIADLHVGDSFPLGGVTRTVTAIEDHDDGTFTVLYTPVSGCVASLRPPACPT